MTPTERYYAEQHAKHALPDPGPVEGTPLIIPQIAGIAPTDGWEKALSDAIAAAERDMMELQGDWFDQPACLEPME